MVGILTNNKGGVYKTTNTTHLGAALSEQGYKVLIIDLDPQCDLTHAVGIYKNDYNIVDFLENKGNFKIKSKAPNFFILPGSNDFVSNKYKVNALYKAIHKKRVGGITLYDHFDFILLDAPVSKIILDAQMKKHEATESELAFFAADFFVVPIQTDFFSVKNADAFLIKVSKFMKQHKKTINFLGFFFGRVLVTSNDKKYYETLFLKNNNILLYKSYIRQDAQIEKAVRNGKTIFQFNPNCRAAADYRKLSLEFLKNIKNVKN